jgi:hypothetical protein
MGQAKKRDKQICLSQGGNSVPAVKKYALACIL